MAPLVFNPRANGLWLLVETSLVCNSPSFSPLNYPLMIIRRRGHHYQDDEDDADDDDDDDDDDKEEELMYW